MMRLLLAVFISCLAACTPLRTPAVQSVVQFKSANTKIADAANGKAVKVVIIGNSIACGQTATEATGKAFDPRSKLIRSGSMFKKILGTTPDGAANPRLSETWPANGWANQLYVYLRNKNPGNTLVNESGSGWDTGDHLGGISGKSFGIPTEDTISKVIERYETKPDIVLLPLQINDWGHGLGSAWFREQYARILDRLTSSLPNAAVVVVIESPVYNRPEAAKIPGNYNEDIVNESGAKHFFDAARDLARERGLEVLDFNTPIDALAKAAPGEDYGSKLFNTGLMADGYPNAPVHPNQAGHDLIAKTVVHWFESHWEVGGRP